MRKNETQFLISADRSISGGTYIVYVIAYQLVFVHCVRVHHSDVKLKLTTYCLLNMYLSLGCIPTLDSLVRVPLTDVLDKVFTTRNPVPFLPMSSYIAKPNS